MERSLDGGYVPPEHRINVMEVDIPAELGDANEQASQFFREGDRMSKESSAELAARAGYHDGFGASCAPSWFNRERAGLFVAFLVAAGGAIDRINTWAGANQEASPERVEAVESVARMELAFDRAADQVRSSESLRSEFSPAEIEVIASELENYPVETFLQSVSEVSGVAADDLATSNKFEFITVYTGDDAFNFVDYLSKEHPGQMKGELEQKAGDLASHGAGLNVDQRAIFLNLSQLQGSDLDDLAWKLRDVTTHELVHGFEHSKFMKDSRTKNVYEGLVEGLANQVGHVMWEDMPTDPFSGYIDGGSASAGVLASSVESFDVWQSLVTGDLDRLATGFDASYGPGSFDSAIHFGSDQSYADVSMFDSLAPVAGLLSTIEANEPGRADEIVAQVNDERHTGRIVRYDEGGASGLFLVSDLTETGLSNGYLAKQGAEQAIFFASNKDPDGYTTYIPDGQTDRLFVFEDLRLYNGGNLLDEAPADDLQEMTTSLVNAHLERFNLLDAGQPS